MSDVKKVEANDSNDSEAQVVRHAGKAWFLYGILAILVIFAFIHFVQSTKVSANEKKHNNTEQGSTKRTSDAGTVSTPVKSGSDSYTVDVTFTGEYNETTYLPAGYMFTITRVSCPYSVKNRDNEEAFGQIGQNAVEKFKTTIGDANSELRFAGQNGKSGHLVILLVSKN